jgi:DNA-binding MarR family transcriptional regulator
MSKDLPHTLAIQILRMNRKRMLLSRIEGIPADWATPTRSLIEDSTLLLLSDRSLVIQELATLIGVEQSWMSRKVARLKKSGSVKFAVDPDDNRRKPLTLTAKGRRDLTDGFKYFKRFSTGLTEGLSLKEQRRLTELLSLFASHLGVQPTIINDSWEIQLELALDRLSRAFSTYDSQMKGAEVSLLELQALTLAESQKIFSVREIAAQLADDASALSRLVAKWVKHGFADALSEQKDLRTNAYSLTSSGKRRYTTALGGFSSVVESGVLGLGHSKTEELIHLLESITKEMPIKPGSDTNSNAHLFFADLSPAEMNKLNVEGERAVGCYIRGEVVGVAFTTRKDRNVTLILSGELSTKNRSLVASQLAEKLQ